MRLSNQALGAIMMALQRSLLEQSDITETLKAFDFEMDAPIPGIEEEGKLIVLNPPVIEMENNA